MKRFKFIFSLFAVVYISTAQDNWLTPFDFGLSLDNHRGIDRTRIPSNIVIGRFNGDNYPDIARFTESRVEVYFRQGNYFSWQPSLVKYFPAAIDSIWLEGSLWVSWWDIKVRMIDGSIGKFENTPGGLRTEDENPGWKYIPPNRVNSLNFDLVWESEGRPFGMTSIAVGDLDSDGINELVTWYKDFEWGDTAYILIYKDIGNDEFDLYMQERFLTGAEHPQATSLMIADLDSNGQKELIYTYDSVYLWEFSSPGQYTVNWSTFVFFRAVQQNIQCDIDNDGIPELAYLTDSWEWNPPCRYYVEEFFRKIPNHYEFEMMFGLFQYWSDDNMAIGDFDNDGDDDIVSGNYGSVSGYDPIDIQYFKYDSIADTFTQHWLHTGVASSCAVPLIADFDNNGTQELYAAGLCDGGSSAFVYEGTGFEMGTVVWRDTTLTMINPNESAFGLIDDIPSGLTVGNWWGDTVACASMFLLQKIDTTYDFIWESGVIIAVSFQDPQIFDMDNDQKENFFLGGTDFLIYAHTVFDYEQTNTGVIDFSNAGKAASFKIIGCYPNPFNSTVNISLNFPSQTEYAVRIYNLKGQNVFSKKGLYSSVGVNVVEWDGRAQSSGIYFISIENDGALQSYKIVLLK